MHNKSHAIQHARRLEKPSYWTKQLLLPCCLCYTHEVFRRVHSYVHCRISWTIILYKSHRSLLLLRVWLTLAPSDGHGDIGVVFLASLVSATPGVALLASLTRSCHMGMVVLSHSIHPSSLPPSLPLDLLPPYLYLPSGSARSCHMALTEAANSKLS